MDFSFHVSFGKKSAPPAPVPASPPDLPGTGATMVALAKAMPPFLATQAQMGNIAAVAGGDGAAAQRLPWSTLRTLADQADLVRLAIEAVKNTVKAQDWDVVTVDKADANPKAAQLLERPDGTTDWDAWASMVLEEILVCDNLSLFPWWSGGRVERAEVVDGDTIRPLVDRAGRIPQHPAEGYEQVSQTGCKRFTTETLWYLPQNRRAKTWRGYSATERLAGRATVNMTKVLKDLSRWTSGGVPPVLLTVEGMTADQARELQKVLDDRALAPGFESRQQIVPGNKATFAPQLRIDKEHEEILVRTIFYCFGVDPTGMVSQVNYSTADALARWAALQGLYPHLWALKSIADRLLRYAGFAGHELRWKAQRDAETQAERQGLRENYKAGLASWEQVRRAEGMGAEEKDVAEEHFFAEGSLVAFDPLGLNPKPEPPTALAWPFPMSQSRQGPEGGAGADQAPPRAEPRPSKVEVGAEAAKAELDRWRTVVRKAVAAGRVPKDFRSAVLSKAVLFRVRRGLLGGAGLGAFDALRVAKAEVVAFGASRAARRSQRALEEAVSDYLAWLAPSLREWAKGEMGHVEKALGDGWHPPDPDKAAWRAFVDALRALYEAGWDEAGEVVGAAVGPRELATLYAEKRAAVLLGRRWDDALGQWVDSPSPWTIAETLRSDVAAAVTDAVRDGVGYSDLAGVLDDLIAGQARALRVARTETGYAYNGGALGAYSEQGVDVVEVMDGDGAGSCDACDAANGQIWSVEYAMANALEHPNCTRAFAPRADLSLADAEQV